MPARRRTREPRITNPDAHPRKFVSLAVAADFLEVDRKTLNTWLSNQDLSFTWFGRRRKIAVLELAAYLERHTVPRETGK
jgi:hypothetical protein